MKKLLLSALLSLFALNIYAQSAMTWNIRYNNPNDGENWWEHRKEWVANLIRFYAPEVLGIQEGLHDQVIFLDSSLTNYTYIGVGRDDGKTKGEYSALFYRTDLLDLVDSGTFWLSETPDQISVGWDASMERICSWAKLKRKQTGQEFWVFNAHLDHRGPESRLNAVKLITQRAMQWNTASLPLLIMGDLNALPEDPPIQFLSGLLNDTRNSSLTPPFGPLGTFNGFDTSHPLDSRIDYIFVNDGVQVGKYAVIADTRNGHTPSDHLPVLIFYGIN